MAHDCIQTETIIKLREKVAAQEAENNSMLQTIKELKDSLSKYNFWFLGIMSTCIFTLIAILLKK